jgi:hypothetical protein
MRVQYVGTTERLFIGPWTANLVPGAVYEVPDEFGAPDLIPVPPPAPDTPAKGSAPATPED